jgi:hypothetical protein
MLEEILEGVVVGEVGCDNTVPGRRAGLGMAMLGEEARRLSVGGYVWPSLE